MKTGFTFVELLLVLVILGGLCVWLLPQFTRTVQQEHQTQVTALEQARALQEQLNKRQQAQQTQVDALLKP